MGGLLGPETNGVKEMNNLEVNLWLLLDTDLSCSRETWDTFFERASNVIWSLPPAFLSPGHPQHRLQTPDLHPRPAHAEPNGSFSCVITGKCVIKLLWRPRFFNQKTGDYDSEATMLATSWSSDNIGTIGTDSEREKRAEDDVRDSDIELVENDESSVGKQGGRVGAGTDGTDGTVGTVELPAPPSKRRCLARCDSNQNQQAAVAGAPTACVVPPSFFSPGRSRRAAPQGKVTRSVIPPRVMPFCRVRRDSKSDGDAAHGIPAAGVPIDTCRNAVVPVPRRGCIPVQMGTAAMSDDEQDTFCPEDTEESLIPEATLFYPHDDHDDHDAYDEEMFEDEDDVGPNLYGSFSSNPQTGAGRVTFPPGFHPTNMRRVQMCMSY